MAASAIDKELLEYVAQLNKAEKESVLQLLKTFFKGRKQATEPDTIEQYNREIDEAEKEIEAGHFITQKELEKEMEKW